VTYPSRPGSYDAGTVSSSPTAPRSMCSATESCLLYPPSRNRVRPRVHAQPPLRRAPAGRRALRRRSALSCAASPTSTIPRRGTRSRCGASATCIGLHPSSPRAVHLDTSASQRFIHLSRAPLVSNGAAVTTAASPASPGRDVRRAFPCERGPALVPAPRHGPGVGWCGSGAMPGPVAGLRAEAGKARRIVPAGEIVLTRVLGICERARTRNAR
jgi:hypothetical protein